MLTGSKPAPVGVALAVMLLGIGCARRPTQLVTLSGSTSLQPLAEKWVAAYRVQHPELTIAVQGGGSTAGVQATVSGAAQIGMVSRALTRAERSSVREVPVARDGIALVVHPSNPISDVTLADARAIYSGRRTEWPKQHGGRALTITVITREEGSGTRAAFETLVLGGSPIVANALVSDSTGAVRQMVATDAAAIGYVSIGLLDATVKPLRLDGVQPNERNIDQGSYPLVRPLLFTVKGEPTRPTAHFMAWVVGSEGRALTRREGMLPAQGTAADASP